MNITHHEETNNATVLWSPFFFLKKEQEQIGLESNALQYLEESGKKIYLKCPVQVGQ